MKDRIASYLRFWKSLPDLTPLERRHVATLETAAQMESAMRFIEHQFGKRFHNHEQIVATINQAIN